MQVSPQQEPITYATKLACVRALIQGKVQWLDTFSSGPKKRPDHEISDRRREVTILHTIADDYRKAVEVSGAKSRG